MSRRDLDHRGLDVQGFGDECADGFVRFPGFGSGGDADFETIAEHSCDLIAGCAGDGFDGEQDFCRRGHA